MNENYAFLFGTLAKLIQFGTVEISTVRTQLSDKSILIRVVDNSDYPGYVVCSLVELSPEQAIATAYAETIAFYRRRWQEQQDELPR